MEVGGQIYTPTALPSGKTPPSPPHTHTHTHIQRTELTDAKVGK